MAVAVEDVGGDQWSVQSSDSKVEASPVCVLLQSPLVVGFRVILSHLPPRPAAPLLSQADVAGESVLRALLVGQENRKWCSPSRACFLWAKEQGKTYEPLIPLSLCLVAACHASSLMAQAVLNFKPAQVFSSWRGLMEALFWVFRVVLLFLFCIA